MTFAPLDIIQLLAAYHAALLAMLLYRQHRLAGLTLLCASFATHMAFNLGVGLDILPPGLDITSAFGLIYGPAFFLFVRGLTTQTAHWSLLTTLHGLPALIIAIWQPDPPTPYIFGLPSLVIYIGLAVRDLHRHKKSRAQWRSDDLAISLDWVQRALIAFIALAIMDIVREVIGFTSGFISDDLALSTVITGVTVLLTLMTLAARAHDARQGSLPDIALRPNSETTPVETAMAYGEAYARIRRLIEEEEAWREPRLSIADLANRLKLNPRDVSRAINLQAETSFSRFINRFRVDALNALMANPDNHGRTLMELAYEVGFNSKSAFNRTYREMTGQTPSEAFNNAKSG